jgi:pSer/pThr/pTyr-binding forkhead associated (FHA) protein
MAKSDGKPSLQETRLDPRQAYPRLKEGLVPEDTGLYLRIEEGQGRGRCYTVSSGGTYLIGRDGADIRLEDVKASRKHAEVALLGPDAYVLRDLASTNGTFLNGKRVTGKVKLSHEDRIRIGDTVLVFSKIEGALPVS